MEQYYRIDSRKIRLREYWRLANRELLPFLIVAVAKLLRISINFQTATPRFNSLCRVDPGELPEVAKDDVLNLFKQAQHEGLNFQFLYSVPLLSRTLGFGATFLSEDGRVVSEILYAREQRGELVSCTKSFTCLSRCDGGMLLATSNGPQMFDPPAQVDALHLPKASVNAILSRHAERLAARKGPAPDVFSPENVERFVVDLNMLDLDDKLKRGVYVPMTEEEVAELRRLVAE